MLLIVPIVIDVKAMHPKKIKMFINTVTQEKYQHLPISLLNVYCTNANKFILLMKQVVEEWDCVNRLCNDDLPVTKKKELDYAMQHAVCRM